METPLIAWVAFIAFVLVMLALDLGVFHRKHHVIEMREALLWSAFWIVLALIFNGIVFLWRGPEDGIFFLTGYVIEKALSVDNIFVFLLIFSYFSVPAQYQHRVLFWGILGALIMRALFIAAGITLLNAFEWILYLFGAFLIYTGIKIFQHKDTEVHPDNKTVVRLARRMMRITRDYEGARFFVRREGVLFVTPLFLVLLVVETTDVVFAVDSIPAVLAITRDPFIVLTSNVFAILGLRALYFVLAGLMRTFHYLHYALSAILVFVGVKMIIHDFFHFPPIITLGIIAGMLGISVVASLRYPARVEVHTATGCDIARHEEIKVVEAEVVNPDETRGTLGVISGHYNDDIKS